MVKIERERELSSNLDFNTNIFFQMQSIILHAGPIMISPGLTNDHGLFLLFLSVSSDSGLGMSASLEEWFKLNLKVIFNCFCFRILIFKLC